MSLLSIRSTKQAEFCEREEKNKIESSPLTPETGLTTSKAKHGSILIGTCLNTFGWQLYDFWFYQGAYPPLAYWLSIMSVLGSFFWSLTLPLSESGYTCQDQCAIVTGTDPVPITVFCAFLPRLVFKGRSLVGGDYGVMSLRKRMCFSDL